MKYLEIYSILPLYCVVRVVIDNDSCKNATVIQVCRVLTPFYSLLSLMEFIFMILISFYGAGG